MGFAVNAARSVPDLHCLCGHCDILPKKFDKPSIATEKSFCNSKGVRIRKQCLRKKKLAPDLKLCEASRVMYQQFLNDHAVAHKRQTNRARGI